MPYADDEKKIGHMKLWRKKMMGQGYGKWLYARRKLRFDDAERFRTALEHISQADSEDRYGDSAALAMQQIALNALAESRRAEERLGPFVPESQI